ncbi:MAG: ABC transporter substrate-binding protein [Deltaproteobacteria bacterium]|nr:ABC transporter substrate-binding protein [Deltaproteobacteria bacterium]
MSSKISEIWWTACPVPSATNIAMALGWLEREFEKDGIRISHISSLPYEDRISHFTLKHPLLIRDGGGIPSIWTRSEGARTKAIGIVCSEASQAVLVRKDSPIRSVKELKGKRVALVRDLLGIIDFRRATVKRGIIMALEAHGLTPDDVRFVDLPTTLAYANRPTGPDRTGAPDHPGFKRIKKTSQQIELEALKSGTVDAIFSYLGRDFVLEQMGATRVIYRLNEHPDWRTLVHNAYPVICAVNADLAEEHPDLIKRWMKVLVRAGMWAKKNPTEVRSIIAKATGLPEEGMGTTHPDDFHEHLVPEISERGIEAIEIEKRFLRDHGFINNDYDVRTWVDGRFLDAALEELESS